MTFETLLNVHYERIYRFAYRWCGNATDAEDITQLACIKLARTIGQFRGEIDGVSEDTMHAIESLTYAEALTFFKAFRSKGMAEKVRKAL